jgi:hypothetical protein
MNWQIILKKKEKLLKKIKTNKKMIKKRQSKEKIKKLIYLWKSKHTVNKKGWSWWSSFKIEDINEGNGKNHKVVRCQNNAKVTLIKQSINWNRPC